MTKTESTDFQELFGASTVRESLDAIAPVIYAEPGPLPTDDPLWEITHVSDGKTAQRLQDVEFVKQVSGWQFPIAQPSKPQPELAKRILADAQRYVARAGEVAKGAPRRKRAMREIVESTLGDFIAKHYPRQIADSARKAEIDAHFGRITGSMEKILSQALVEVN